MRVLVVDDEAPARSRMRDLLADVNPALPLAIVGEAANGRDALKLAEAGADVVLLDVRMPGMDGIEVAQHLRKLEPPPAVIFTTAYDAYAIQAFDLHVVDYLLKPIKASRLQEALSRIAARSPAPPVETLRAMRPAPRSCLSAAERGRVHLIPLEDVLYLRAELKYVTVRTGDREYLIEESLTQLEQEFPDRFVRVHRNCLVARAAIRGFERAAADSGEGPWQVVLAGLEERIPVSRRQQHVVRGLVR
ncbi:MAG: response regulator transcription factor [Burkholderiales bacterium]|nr:response regulator transcription factor [Burkholderiales bacterium]MCW5576835.1 response regulator transcription factor [Burkholderiales bacterium]